MTTQLKGGSIESRSKPAANVSANALDPAQLTERAIERRAVEAAVWGMPIVAFDAMRQGFFGLGAKYGDIAYFSKPADWKLQLTTPNSSSLYVYSNFNLKEGPVVIDFPAAVGAGLFGSIMDAWQVPIADVGPEGEDQGKGGKYLLMPPEFNGEPPAGYFPLRFNTYNGYALFRAIPKTRSEEDTAKALTLVKHLRVYPLAQSANPAASRHIDAAGQPFEGIANFDDTFYDSLAKMVNEEPVQVRDTVAMGQLRSLGIEKGKEFKPDANTRAILTRAIDEAHANFMEAVSRLVPYWPNAHWGVPAFLATGARTAFTYQTESGLDLDGRGAMFFSMCAAPKKLGVATFYLLAATDAADAPLDGANSYHLHLPPNVPAKQFWAVTVYDLESGAFIRESPKTEFNSYQDLQKNADGSVDMFFGPLPPAGNESNWIFTELGKRWFAGFRFYGPETAIHDKSWRLPDIEPAGEGRASAH